jgi:hypothetical protein
MGLARICRQRAGSPSILLKSKPELAVVRVFWCLVGRREGIRKDCKNAILLRILLDFYVSIRIRCPLR